MKKALVVIDIQNDITKHYRDIIAEINNLESLKESYPNNETLKTKCCNYIKHRDAMSRQTFVCRQHNNPSEVCGNCDGTGEVMRYWLSVTYYKKCKKCEGTGKIDGRCPNCDSLSGKIKEY